MMGMLLQGGALGILEAVFAGLALVLAVPALLAGAPLTGRRGVDVALLLVVIGLAIFPHVATPFLALALFFGARHLGHRQKRALA